MKKMFGLMMMVCMFFMQSMHALRFMESLYAKILGDKDISLKYRQEMCNALEACGVSDVHRVPIKSMNAIGSKIAGTELSSFTAFGIWLNEEMMNVSDAKTRMFSLYHEASHYASNHHAKLIGQCAAVGTATWASFCALKKLVPQLAQVPGHSSAPLIASTRGVLIALPSLVKYQEKEADINAVRVLCQSGKSAIVRSYIEKLSFADQADQDIYSSWGHPHNEQLKYLIEAYGRYALS